MLHDFFAAFSKPIVAIMEWLDKRVWKSNMPSTDNNPIVEVVVQPEAPQTAQTPATAPQTPEGASDSTLDFSTPQKAFHAVRVLCDLAGLSLEQKNIICACIYQESGFKNEATHANVLNGNVVSTDWGICQVNDYYHIGRGKDFPSVVYVMDNPKDVVIWMIDMYDHGLLKQWVSYSSGAYQKWLIPTSPMWLLKS